MFSFVAGGEIQIVDRGLLRFLDEPVQQDHATPFIDIKKNTGNPVAAETGADLV